ncbi:MAG: metalloregulator ArsR/SmtB family transcription factor [Candidatus Dormiibacterota bacterium]
MIQAPVFTDAATLARFFRVLADPTRLRLLAALESGERTVNDLVNDVGGAQARISTHLACLRHCGFVTTERRGRQIVYRLSLSGLDGLLEDVRGISAPAAERLATCTRIGPDWI